MPRSYLDPPRPIAALATAPGESALAVVRATGEGSIELAAACFSRPEALRSAPGHSLVHGVLLDPASGEAVDEVLVAVFRGPRSPTGEDQVEFSCHGSPAVQRRVLALLETVGFAQALPGEFGFRAFVNGKTDLVKAEALDELVRSRSEGARAEALRRLEGGLSRRLLAARGELLGLLAEAEVRLDYAEEDGSPAELFPRERLLALRDFLSGLAASYAAGRLYREGARLALAGRTNAGKSSLFNLLLREERSIVSAEPGTTRDWIEAGIELAGLPLRLLDTAGLREAPGAVEAEGVSRARRFLEEAELVLYLADGREGILPEDEASLALRPDAIKVWNKVDDAACLPPPPGWLGLSARSGAGFPELAAAIEAALRGLLAAAGGGVSTAGSAGAHGAPAAEEQALRIASLRQKGLLEAAAAALDEALLVLEASERSVAAPPGGAGAASSGPAARGGAEWLDAAALELREAAEALGEITGEIAGPEVLEAVFSRFCLGK